MKFRYRDRAQRSDWVYDPDRTLQRQLGDNVQIGREQFGHVASQESEQLQSRCHGQTA
jgi:hypothetical protein